MTHRYDVHKAPRDAVEQAIRGAADTTDNLDLRRRLKELSRNVRVGDQFAVGRWEISTGLYTEPVCCPVMKVVGRYGPDFTNTGLEFDRRAEDLIPHAHHTFILEAA